MPLFYEKNGNVTSFGLTIGDSFADLEKAVNGCGKFYLKLDSMVNIPYCKISDNLPVVTLCFRLQQDDRIESLSLKGSLLTPIGADRLYSFLTDMFNKEYYTVELLHRAGNNLLVCTFYNDNIRISISRYKDFGIKGKDAISLSVCSVTHKSNHDYTVRPAAKASSPKQNKTIVWLMTILAIVGIVIAFFVGRMTNSTSDTIQNGLYSSDSQTNDRVNMDRVYICTGTNAKKYHSIPNCRWLENCSGEIKEVSLDDAEKQGKSPCKGCH